MIDAVKLRRALLQDAMKGKLTEQRPEDGNARDIVREAVIGEFSNEEKIPFEIPANWCWCRLGYVADVISGQSPEGKSINKTDGIEFHQGKIAFGQKYIMQSEFRTRKPTKIAPAGSVLLSVRAPVGNVNLTDRDICIGRGLATFRCKGIISKDYFYCVMLAYERIFRAQGRGTTFDGITAKMIRRQIIPIPPLAEQRRIVALLDPIMQEIETLNEHIHKLNSARRAFWLSMIDETINGKDGQELPEGWRMARFGEAITVLRGVSYNKWDMHRQKRENDCLILRGCNIRENAIEFVTPDNIYVDKSLVADKKLLRKHDIVMVSSTASTKVIGRAGTADNNYSDVAPGAFLLLLRPADNVFAPYVAYYVQSMTYRNRIRWSARGGGIKNLRLGDVTDAPFPLPPLKEQKMIVAFLDSIHDAMFTAE